METASFPPKSGVGVGVGVDVLVGVFVGVIVDVFVGVAVGVGLNVLVGAALGVGVDVGDSVVGGANVPGAATDGVTITGFRRISSMIGLSKNRVILRSWFT